MYNSVGLLTPPLFGRRTKEVRNKLTILMAMALMGAMMLALSGVAQAAPISDKADAQCAKLAIQTLGPSFNPSNYTFIGGTEGEGSDDRFDGLGTDGPDVFCGFGGDDSMRTLDAGDIFLGGAGHDEVIENHGTFFGGEGIDMVVENGSFDGTSATFFGGAGDDIVTRNYAGSTFDGGDGIDAVHDNLGGALISVEQGDV